MQPCFELLNNTICPFSTVCSGIPIFREYKSMEKIESRKDNKERTFQIVQLKEERQEEEKLKKQDLWHTPLLNQSGLPWLLRDLRKSHRTWAVLAPPQPLALLGLLIFSTRAAFLRADYLRAGAAARKKTDFLCCRRKSWCLARCMSGVEQLGRKPDHYFTLLLHIPWQGHFGKCWQGYYGDSISGRQKYAIFFLVFVIKIVRGKRNPLFFFKSHGHGQSLNKVFNLDQHVSMYIYGRGNSN